MQYFKQRFAFHDPGERLYASQDGTADQLRVYRRVSGGEDEVIWEMTVPPSLHRKWNFRPTGSAGAEMFVVEIKWTLAAVKNPADSVPLFVFDNRTRPL